MSHRIDRDDGGVVHAPAPAVVVSIVVKPGDMVSIGDRLAVLEAMKMEMQVTAPFSGKVRQIMTIPNVQVDTGAPLVQIDPVAGEEGVVAGERVVFGNSQGCRNDPFSLPPESGRTPGEVDAGFRCGSCPQRAACDGMGCALSRG